MSGVLALTTPPDVVVLGPEWPTRALLRAQLIEEGYEVVATDAWPIPREFLRAGMKPRVLIVDLHGLSDPHGVLSDVRALFKHDRVLVVTGLGTLAADDIGRYGFHSVARPASIGEIVAEAARLLKNSPGPASASTRSIAPMQATASWQTSRAARIGSS